MLVVSFLKNTSTTFFMFAVVANWWPSKFCIRGGACWAHWSCV